MSTHVLIVDRDEAARAVCRRATATFDLDVQEVSTVDDVFELLSDTRSSHLLLLGLASSDLYRIAEVRSRFPYVDIIVLAEDATVSEATQVMRRGALDYIPKPLDEAQLTEVIRRWRQRREMKEENEHLSEVLHLMELGRTLTSTLELDDLYDQIIKLVQRAFLCDTVSLMLLEEENGDREHLVLAAQRGLPSQVAGETKAPLEESIAGLVAREGRPLLLLGGLEGTPYEDLARGGAIGSAMSIPLKVQRRMVGVLNVNRRPGRSNYTEHDVQLLHVFASQIAIAIQNARLYEDVREERDRILSVQEQVRRELARNLHDGLAQLLATGAMNIDHTRMLLDQNRIDAEGLDNQLEYLRQTIRQAVRETRSFIFGLRPLVLETKGLVPALESFLEQVREGERSDTTYRLVTGGDGSSGASLPEEVPLSDKRLRVVFSIVQEAVQNARKHAEADTVQVHLFVDEDQEALICRVEDDGIGFDVSAVEASYDEEYSFGMLNMREQAELIESELYIRSSTGEGTCVELNVPLDSIQNSDGDTA